MTNYSLVDIAGLLLSTLSDVPLLLAPGLAIGWAAGWATAGPRASGADAQRPAEPWLAAGLLAGLAALPVILSLAVRTFGLNVALGADLAIGAAGVGVAVRTGWRPRLSRQDALLALAWLLVVGFEYIDFDVAGGLHQPFLILDLVKHAATVQAIHDHGAPPDDPFFLRSGRVGYYYFFYTLGALSEQLCGGGADARAAMGGLVFWTGVAFYNLVRFTLARAGLSPAPWSPRTGRLVFAVMCIGGLDIVAVVLLARWGAGWLPDPVWWNEQIGGVFDSLIWVPHHVTALIASVVGLMAISEPAPAGRLRRAVFAGVCFASAFGLSVWVTVGAVATAGCWFTRLVWGRRAVPAMLLLLAGAVALVLSLPQLLDLHAGRAPGPTPVALAVRAFSPLEITVPPGALRTLLGLVCLPLSYLLEFGLLAWGAVAFWRREERPRIAGELGMLLAISAACGLVIGSFFKSTVYNNDLGWRVMLFPLLAGVVWTVSVLERRLASATTLGSTWRALPPTVWLMGAVGLATVLYTLVNQRTYDLLPLPASSRFFATDPKTQHDLRGAYTWADHHLPADAVLQHDPAAPRVFPFGLYGRNRVAVADGSAALFGASQTQVDARVAQLSPLFSGAMTAAEVRARAQADGVDALVVDDADPVWRRPASWVWTSRPLYAAPRARIISTAALGGPP